jgi:drug/metabolite transporter (DMT)-like permease
VAILLGWLLAGEPLAARTGIAMAVILGSVVLITRSGLRRPAGARTADR